MFLFCFICEMIDQVMKGTVRFMTQPYTYETAPQFFQVNIDSNGSRNLSGTQELVEYYKNTSHRIWLNRETSSFEPHWHQALEIIMPVDNHYDVYVNDVHYHIVPDEILLIPPRKLHSTTAPETGQRFIFLLDISLMSKLKGFVGIQTLLANPLLLSAQTYPFIYQELEEIITNIRDIYFENGEFAELAIQSKLLTLFIKLGEDHNNAKELFFNVTSGKQQEYVQKFSKLLEFIDDHYTEDLCLEDIASMAGFSKFHFSRLFKQYTNFTFTDYLCYKRINAAAELLEKSELSITEIALSAGFQSIPTFNRLFKKQNGCSPRAYRNSKHY